MTTLSGVKILKRSVSLWRPLQLTIIFLSLGCLLFMPISALFLEVAKDEEGRWTGFGQAISYLSNPTLLTSFQHSLTIALWTTVFALSFGFVYAFAISRTNVKGKRVLLGFAMLPLFVPTMMHGIALIYLFGRQGIVTTGLFGLFPGVDIELYGPVGIVMAEIIYTFPQVVLLMYVALRQSDQGLYDAAKTMGISSAGRLFGITIPSIRLAFVSAGMVAFTLSFTDYGAPKLVGGQYNVLATDVYKQVVGQQNFALGAVAGILLMTPALIAFVVDQSASQKPSFSLNAKAKALEIGIHRVRDVLFGSFAYGMALVVAVLFLMMIVASVTPVWPYTFGFSLEHFTFNSYTGDGFTVFLNSLIAATGTAVFGTLFAFLFAYWLQNGALPATLAKMGHFMSLLPMAVPGLVIGISYVLFFSRPEWLFFGLVVPNMLHALYGTMAIVIVSTVLHFFSVTYMTARTALKKLDAECEQVAKTLGLTRIDTFLHYTLPSCAPALLEMAMYFFVNSMVTISAVIFLYTPDTKTAAVSIVSLDDAGNIEAAAAMGLLIVLVNVVVRFLYEQLLRMAGKRTKRKGETA
ncbi:ABC transporter permease subunit [Domibacillus aminovorans]|uniref:Phosphonate ABC transporter permease n=1 Tax=Domibacillus aminovorans TaxID=29332 RepID=A0A177L6S6_9BACI|nr:ABC transporter permease subunit [Domibacillus aminovorans]OAH61154.1 phosphonate ABC transporter permease [Domibacillus aminovorans]